MKPAIALLGIVVSSVAGCRGGPMIADRPDMPYVQGRVTESAPSETVRLSGVTIRVVETGAAVTSGSTGDFTLTHVPASGTLEASAPGYQPATAAFVAGRFQPLTLSPVFAIVTDTLSATLLPTDAKCIDPDEFYSGPCRRQVFFVHHAGLIDIALSWAGEAEFVLSSASRTQGKIVETKIGKSGTLTSTFEALAGSAYEVSVYQTRGALTDFTMTATHPN